MILNEKELYELKKEKRILFPAKKKIEKKSEKPDSTPMMISALRSVFDLVNSVKDSVASNLKAVNAKMDYIIENQKSEPKAEKKPDKWDFKIIRDIDNRILKIEATRRS